MGVEVPQIGETICLEHSDATADENGRTSRKAYHLIVLLACAAVLTVSFVLQPREEGLSLLGYRWPFHCWLNEYLGVNCALCGMSRSFCSLAHGDFGASLAFHGVGPFLFLFFCLQIPYRLYALAILPRAVHPGLMKAHLALVMVLCAGMACHWLLYLEGLIV